MKRILEEIIDRNTEGNYLLSSSDKAQMISEILDLFSVSCQCDACKQDRIDSDYRKYLKLSKNVIGYD